MYLFIDTELSDIPETWFNDSPSGPRLVQLSWILTDSGRNHLAHESHIIKPKTPVTAMAAAVHGITTEMAIERGERIEKVLVRFNEAVNQARLIIGYNIRLDELVINAELSRTGIKSNFPGERKKCLLEYYKTVRGNNPAKSRANRTVIPHETGQLFRINNPAKSIGSLTLEAISQQLFNHAYNDLTDVELIEKCFFHDML